MYRRFFLLAAIALFAATAAFAAGEWEWTANQGWMRGAGVARPTPNEQLHYAYELEQRGEFMDAARQYFLLVQNFPDSQEAGVGLQRLARCLFEMENYYTSYRAIEQVIETYPNTGRMSDLVEIELRIAKRLMVSQTPDLLGGGEDPRTHNIRRAIEIIDSVIEHDPYGPVAAEAYLVKGEGHLFLNEVNAARTAFEAIRDEFPRSDFVERARLGILTCDSLVGQASPAEVQEQANVVRELERDRAASRNRGSGRLGLEDPEEMDSVEDSIRKLAEVEAAKMLEQAEQYRTMGTRQSVESSQFLYREVARRYPNTPQAEEALARLDNVRLPANENRFLRVVKNINLNPFTYTKDPDPPWIVPQMNAEDQVMIDPGLGPIAGVPETGAGAPETGYSTGVRPANLPNQPPASFGGNFSPLSAAPPSAPDFVDGVDRPPARNPLTTVSESDLVLPPGSRPPPTAQRDFIAGRPAGYAPPPAGYGAPDPRQPAPGYSAPAYGSPYGGQPQQPAPAYSAAQGAQRYPTSLGSAASNAPYSDLVGAPPGGNFSQPAYGAPAYGQPQYAPPQGYSPPPQQQYGQQGYYSAAPQYAPQNYSPAPGYSQPAPQGGNGRWTLAEDFR